MEINNLKESISYLREINKNNPNRFYTADGYNIDLLEYNVEEGSISLEWYEAILEKVLKYNPKRVVDVGSNINLFGYLFANKGIEYIGIDICKDVEPITTDKIHFIFNDYNKIKEDFKDDIIISCLCVGYLLPIKDIVAKHLIIDGSTGTNENYKCIAKEIY